MQFLKQCVAYVLMWEARAVLYRHKPRIIAVTGSMGKTTAKDAIYASLSKDLYIRKSEKSLNSELGVPLTILGLESGWSNPFRWMYNIVRGLGVILGGNYPKWLVLEVGADRPGDIRSIACWLRPDVAVITGVPDVPVHVEYFNSPEELLREKRSLAEYLKPGGKLVVNGDDIRMKNIQSDFRGATVTYGLDGENDFHASHSEIAYEHDVPVGMSFRVNHSGCSVPVSVFGAIGSPRLYAALAAMAVGDCIGVDSVSIANSLSKWSPPPGRMRLIDGLKGSLIIDDTYNSSPAAVMAALDTLRDVRANRRIAILGDMLELGKYSASAHKNVGERVAVCADMLITVGLRSRAIAAAALDAGMSDSNIRQYDLGESSRAGKELEAELAEGDVILVKGSQGLRMEKTVLEIMAEPQRASELLVRMEADWMNR